MTAAYWSQFGYCPTCDQTAGGPCFDLRYGRNNRAFHRNRAHADRPRLVAK